MTKILRLTAAALILAGMAGCKMDVTPELYVSDLRAVVGGETGLTTPATLAIGVGSKENCEKQSDAFAAMLKEMVREFSLRGCEGSGTDVALTASIQIPIVATEEAWKEARTLYGVVVRAMDERIGVFFLVDPRLYADLNERIKKETYRSIDLDESRVKVVLSNDERREVRFTVNDAYFNGRPVQGLERRTRSTRPPS